MAFTFACPACKAELHLPDETAGESGQCPRCQAVIRIPSSSQPRAVVTVGTTAPEEAPPRPTRTPEREPTPRRQSRSAPLPRTPVWPTLVGLLGALVCVALLLSSVITLFSVRAPVQRRTEPMHPRHDIRIGHLEGPRIILQDGSFEVRSSLTHTDPIDADQANCRCKTFEIELIAGRTYVFDQECPAFDGVLRLETFEGVVRERAGGIGDRNPLIEFTPERTAVFLLIATSDRPALGPFTLFIDEEQVRKK